MPLIVVITACTLACERFGYRMLFELFNRALQVFKQQSSQIAAQAKTR